MQFNHFLQDAESGTAYEEAFRAPTEEELEEQQYQNRMRCWFYTLVAGMPISALILCFIFKAR